MGGTGFVYADGAVRHYHRVKSQKLSVIVYVKILIIIRFVAIGMPAEKTLALRSEVEIYIAFFFVEALTDTFQKPVGMVCLSVPAKDADLIFSVFHYLLSFGKNIKKHLWSL